MDITVPCNTTALVYLPTLDEKAVKDKDVTFVRREGNFYGGLVQGVGLALTEDFEDLNHDTTLKNCGIPYPKDAPDDIELHFNETYRPSGPYGAAGCGEAPLDAPHPAILNAIYNATGARITRVPARPERVLAALKELEK